MKTDRHKKILEVIDRYEVGTQEELAKILNDDSVDGKRTRYATLTKDKPVASDKFLTVLKEGFVSMDMAQNILVIKTAPGMAMAVCAAIDALEWNEIVGSIAGDDTIMCAVRTVNDTLLVMNKIKKLIKNN